MEIENILEEYAALRTLRYSFSKVPIMVLSATITPTNILGYIRKSFYFYISTLFYKNPLNCPYIIQIVNLIAKQGFGDLDFRVPRVDIIQKTMIFIEKIEYIMVLAAHLQKLLLRENCDREEDLIMMFYSNIESTIRVDIMENFWNREIKILICKDVVGIGVNISNITYMI